MLFYGNSSYDISTIVKRGIEPHDGCSECAKPFNGSELVIIQHLLTHTHTLSLSLSLSLSLLGMKFELALKYPYICNGTVPFSKYVVNLDNVMHSFVICLVAKRHLGIYAITFSILN